MLRGRVSGRLSSTVFKSAPTLALRLEIEASYSLVIASSMAKIVRAKKPVFILIYMTYADLYP